MRAAYIEEHGGPEVLKVCERPDPEPGPGDALVQVEACGLNHLDIWVRLGGKRPFPLPLIPGSDPAGIVLEAPPGSGLEPGDEVVIYPCEGHGDEQALASGDDQLCPDFRIYGAARDGGLAEKIAVPAANCFAKPEALSMREAADSWCSRRKCSENAARVEDPGPGLARGFFVIRSPSGLFFRVA